MLVVAGTYSIPVGRQQQDFMPRGSSGYQGYKNGTQMLALAKPTFNSKISCNTSPKGNNSIRIQTKKIIQAKRPQTSLATTTTDKQNHYQGIMKMENMLS